MKSKLFLILSLLMGIVAAGSVYWYLNNLETKYQQAGEAGQVVVAQQTIPAKSRISADKLTVRSEPLLYIHPDAARTLQEAAGGITAETIYAGEQILKSRVVKEEEANKSLSFAVSEGKRAVSLAANQVTGVSGFLVPGDRVDIVATVEPAVQSAQKELVSGFVVQNVRVLAIGPLVSKKNTSEAQKDFETVTVEVTPEETLPLVLAAEKGKLRLLLRPVLETRTPAVPPFHFNQFSQPIWR